PPLSGSLPVRFSRGERDNSRLLEIIIPENEMRPSSGTNLYCYLSRDLYDQVAMIADAVKPEKFDTLTAARQRVSIAPVPTWVNPISYSSDFKPDSTNPSTYL